MVSDSITSGSIPSAAIAKDFSKKKRVNRSAKLKRCKMDARREQWLSQGKNKGPREDWEPGHRRGRGSDQPLDNLGMNRSRDEDNDGSIHQYSDSESQSDSPTDMMGVLDGNHSVGKCAGSVGLLDCDHSVGKCAGSSTTSSSFSCGSSVGCCSGSTTEVEEGDDGCLDDWEAVADALAANDRPPQNPPLGNVSENENPLSQGQLSTESENPGIEHVGHAHVSAPTSNQAWRPDDASRPPSLPNLSKQYSLPINVRHCGNGSVLWAHIPSPPSSCPICYEDLDKTDSSFLPCLCGFRLCLFCHKRILEEDGRCPGCRQPYQSDTVEADPSLLGGCLTLRLARSYSLVTKT